MGFILPAIASAFASKLIGGSGGQQQGQEPIFNWQKRPRVPMAPVSGGVALRGVDPTKASLADNPILAAYVAAAPATPTTTPEAPAKEKQATPNFKDAFLQSLTQGIVQRMLFGGGGQQAQYAPPTFR